MTEQETSADSAGSPDMDMLLASFTTPVMLLDKTCRILSWNKLCETVDRFSAGLKSGISFYAAFPQTTRNGKIASAVQQALNGTPSALSPEDGYSQDNFFDYHFVPLKNRQGEITGVLHILHDATNHLHITDELQQLKTDALYKNKELQKLSKTLMAVHRSLSDHLFKPLHKTYSFIEMLANEVNLTSTGAHYFSRIKQLVCKSKSVADDLLSYMALDNESPRPAAIDMNQFILFIKSSLHREITLTNARIKCHHLPSIAADRALVFFVFTELIRNALKFRSESAPVITVTGGETQAELLSGDHPQAVHHIWIKVTDNGTGIPEPSGSVFQLFGKSPGSRHPGNGAGLSLCKKIMELHNGSISFVSQPGAGSSFTCYFPAAL